MQVPGDDLVGLRARLTAAEARIAELERDLAERTGELAEASAHRSQFLAAMSHELRTPLNAIIGYSEMLQEEITEPADPGLLADLGKIQAAGQHLLSLVNALLDLAKIEAGHMEVRASEFRVVDLLDEVRTVAAPLVEKNGSALAVELGPGLATMRSDPGKLRQALLNLLSNAARFTERGRVVLRAARADDWLTFAVADTGIGLGPEQIERLFADPSPVVESRRDGGSGLGLTLARHFCAMLGGELTVESAPGAGVTFAIRVPAVVPRSGESASVDTGAAPGQAGTVLVVDDDPAARELMQRLLAREGFRVVTADSGEEGLRQAHELRPDAITLDVLLPGVDGWTVLAALKSDPAVADTPVVMLTIVDDAPTGLALGAADVLTKPVDRRRLLATLRRLRSGGATAGGRVLVVDDDATTRAMLRRQLERDGWAVDEAANGREALARMVERLPTLILLDLAMPEVDGFEFARLAREHDEWRGVPIVVLTARDVSASERRQLGDQVARVVQKGASGELVSQLRDLIATRARAGGRP